MDWLLCSCQMNNISANKYVGQTEAWGYTYVLINITKQGQQQPI